MVRNILAEGTMIISRLTTKAQTTIPLPVRSALGVGPGDVVAYHIQSDGSVLLTKASPAGEDPFHGFEEWDSEADRAAYARL